MADDPKMTATDRKVIDASQEYDCRYWSDRFRISTDELKQAVEAAGPMVDDVARYLGKSADEVTLATSTGVGAAGSQTGILETAQRAGRDATDFAKKKAQEARQVAERTTDEVMKFISARPFASVLVGAAVGYVLGWVAAGAVRQRLRERRTTRALRSAPLERERLVQLREWPRTTRGRAH